MTGLSPGYAQGSFTQMLFNFESLNTPLSWTNLDMENESVAPLYILIVLAASIVFYTLLTVYAWPFRMVKDGRRVGWCYCCSSDYYKHRSANEVQSLEAVAKGREDGAELNQAIKSKLDA